MLMLWLIGSLAIICGLLTFLELGTMVRIKCRKRSDKTWDHIIRLLYFCFFYRSSFPVVVSIENHLHIYISLGTNHGFFFFLGAEKTYLGYIYPRPRQIISFLFMILVGVCSRCGSLAQVKKKKNNNKSRISEFEKFRGNFFLGFYCFWWQSTVCYPWRKS
jgi:CDP-diglyceride synthetase